MFNYIKGPVDSIDVGFAVIECAGIGFQLNASLNTLSHLHTGETAKLYVSEAIGENNFDLFGFYSKSEKKCFEMLISVSGIGPKAAISILSCNTPEQLSLAIINEDYKALTAAPGVGKKIAMRVVVELKDKMGKEFGGAEYVSIPAASAGNTGSKTLSDAVAALNVLGYSSSDINRILASADISGLTTEQIIKFVLKNIDR